MPTVTAYSTSETIIDNDGSASWLNLGFIRADDSNRATKQTQLPDPNDPLADAENFGLDALIPAGATITGVRLESKVRANTLNPNRVGFMKISAFVSGVQVTTEHGPVSPIGTVDVANSYDVTGEYAWTRADLLDGVFKIRLHQQRLAGGSTNSFGEWNYVRVSVDYDVTGIKVKQGGVFVTKPRAVRAGGVFTDKPTTVL